MSAVDMTPAERAKFDQTLEAAIATSMRMAAEQDHLSVEDAMVEIFDGYMALVERMPIDVLLVSLAMNVAGLSVRMHRQLPMPELAS